MSQSYDEYIDDLPQHDPRKAHFGDETRHDDPIRVHKSAERACQTCGTAMDPHRFFAHCEPCLDNPAAEEEWRGF